MTPTMLTFDGTTQSVTEWALDYGITPHTISRRLRKGWSVGRAITTPIPSKPGARLSGSYLDAATGEHNPKHRNPGVVSDFGAFSGTGVGRNSQDRPNISFSEKEVKV
jgi:hypothetical protein